MAKVDSKQVMSIAKKNTLTIVSAVVALGAIAVPFLYSSTVVTEVQTQLDARAAEAKRVSDISTKARTLPKLDLDATDTKPLEVFPTKNIIDAGNAAVADLKKQSDALLDEALKYNVKTPLYPAVFLEQGPRYTTAFYVFLDRYKQIFPEQGRGFLTSQMNAGTPYDPAEITLRVAEAKDKIMRDRALRQGGQVINQAEVQALQQRAEVEVPLMLRKEVATSYSAYVSPDAWTPAVEVLQSRSGSPLRPDQVWYAQLGLWIQEDVARIIASANTGSKSVFTSPVKHLVKVGFATTPPFPYVLPRSAGAEGGTAAVPVTKVDSAAPVTLVKQASLTGRLSNGMYDVVHYTVVVRVAEPHVTTFLAEIPRGKLHYVLNVDMKSVDSSSLATTGYVYGADRVVELTVDCEALYLRAWTSKLMPKAVRQAVGIEEAPVVAAPGGGF